MIERNRDNYISMLFAGDFSPCRDFENIVINKQSEVLGEAQSIIKNTDVSFVNLECPLTKSTKAINKTGPALKADPDCILALKDFSVIGLANNHILDYGKKGLEDTLEACGKANLSTVGAGLNLEHATKPFIKLIKNKKIAIIAIAEHEFNQSEDGGCGSAGIDPIDNYYQIKEAQRDADIVIVTLHGGNEYFPYPRPGLRKICHYFIDLGVDAVVCHHPHVPGAYEEYKNKPIIYSLGNFIFDNPNPPKGWDIGYLLKLKFDTTTAKNDVEFDLIPYQQSVKLNGIRILKGKEKDDVLASIDKLNHILTDDLEWNKAWQKLLEERSNDYIVQMLSPVMFRGLVRLSRYLPISKILLNKNNTLLKLNLLRCQSHYEILVAALQNRAENTN